MSPTPTPDRGPSMTAPVDVAPTGVSANTEMLYSAENSFAELAMQLDAARLLVESGRGQGDQFGLEARLSDLGGSHDTLIASMCTALAHGSQRMTEIADRLRDTAHAYAETDLNAAATITATGG